MWRSGDVIFVEGNTFRSENEIYEIKYVDKFLNKARKRRKIIIYNESVYNKEIYFPNCNSISEKEIDERIKEEFGVNKNYLFNYDKRIKDKLINVYAVKSGDTIAAISKNAKHINVIPVQMIIKKILQKEINKKSWASIIKIKECYYFLLVKEGVLKTAIADKDYREIISRIDNIKEIYIQKEHDYIKEEFKDLEKLYFIKGALNEKIIKKQKLPS